VQAVEVAEHDRVACRAHWVRVAWLAVYVLISRACVCCLLGCVDERHQSLLCCLVHAGTAEYCAKEFCSKARDVPGRAVNRVEVSTCASLRDVYL